MSIFQCETASEQETVDLGNRVARFCQPADIVCLIGELGSGKTTFVKGLAKGLKVSPFKVNSPTFVLLNIYEGRLSVYHFDLYRLDSTVEISLTGYEEFLYGKGIAVVEWADKLGVLTPREYLKVELKHTGAHKRTIKISSVGKRHLRVVEGLSKKAGIK